MISEAPESNLELNGDFGTKKKMEILLPLLLVSTGILEFASPILALVLYVRKLFQDHDGLNSMEL